MCEARVHGTSSWEKEEYWSVWVSTPWLIPPLPPGRRGGRFRRPRDLLNLADRFLVPDLEAYSAELIGQRLVRGGMSRVSLMSFLVVLAPDSCVSFVRVFES